MRQIPKDVIEKAATGDMDAFEKIYKEYSSTVYTLAFGVTQNRQDAEETTQDTFVKIFRGLKNFKFESSFGTWLYRITMNTAINIYRKRARQQEGSTAYNEVEYERPAGSDISRDQIERQDAASRVAEILKNINPEHRSCIVLREIEGLNYREMADVLRIPLNTVRSRLKRAREAIVAYCRKEGDKS